jgi:mannose-6-phosphate isomerase class I
MQSFEEFASIFHPDIRLRFVSNPCASTFKAVMSQLLRSPPRNLPVLTDAFFKKLSQRKTILDNKTIVAIQQIRRHFPNDIGLFSPLLLNVVTAEPGQALFIPPRTLHAYLSGDLYEAMAVSDNVVRAAMTHKFVDVNTLVKMLNFDPLRPQWVKGVEIQPSVKKYTSPCPDFCLYRTKLEGNQSVELPFDEIAITLLFDGDALIDGEKCEKGTVLLHPPGGRLRVRGLSKCELVSCTSAGKKGLVKWLSDAMKVLKRHRDADSSRLEGTPGWGSPLHITRD